MEKRNRGGDRRWHSLSIVANARSVDGSCYNMERGVKAVKTVPQRPPDKQIIWKDIAHPMKISRTAMVQDESADAYAASLFSAKNADRVVRCEQPNICPEPIQDHPGPDWRAGAA